jgi:aryl-alcohol dehydrogenase-like predicted oxidoreductase
MIVIIDRGIQNWSGKLSRSPGVIKYCVPGSEHPGILVLKEIEFMRYRRLGRTNLSVSEIGHGLWGMSGWSGSDDQSSAQALQTAADLGCNFFDTAWAYGQGNSDRLLGQLLSRNPRKHLYAASKVPPKNLKWPASSADRYEDVFPEEHVLKYVQLIRAALGVEIIDLLQFHVWDDSWTDNKEWRLTVEKLKKEGLIRYFGLSLNRWEPFNGIKAIRTGCVDTVQVIYNIFDQSPEDELFRVCDEMDVGIIARVPLDEGSLAGNLTLDTRFPEGDWRSRYFGPENLPATMKKVSALKAVLPAGMTLPEMALRFILTNQLVSTTIVGMRSENHVRSNLALTDRGGLHPDLLEVLRKHRWDREVASWAS